MRKKITLCGLIVTATLLLAAPAMAQGLSSSGVMNDVLKRFHDAASTWGPTIEAAASRLFWSLVVISMVWTFGMMALRKADIGEFFAELLRFTIFTGFFWWLLTNANQGMNIAGTIVRSLQDLGAQAGHLPSGTLGPSSILDLGFDLYNRTVEAILELGWRQMATSLVMELMALAILFVLALISVNLLLLLVAAWILLYTGVFFLGFGGSRWTSDMAINYYKTVLGIAAQLMAMVLLVAIGKQFINHYYTQISENLASQELAVMLVISVILLFLVNKVPPMISGLVSGGGVGAAGGIGNFGAGAAIGAGMAAASMASSGAAMAGRAMMATAAGSAGGAQAIMAAFSEASENAASGGGESMPLFRGYGGNSSPGAGNEPLSGTNNSEYAQAAGFGSASIKPGEVFMGTVAKAARITTGAGGILAKAAVGHIKDAMHSRISETTGGKIAESIKGQQSSGTVRGSQGATSALFGPNSLSSEKTVDPESEIAAFVNRNQGA